MKRLGGLICLAAGIVLASVLWADEGVVKTRDGNSYQGDVTENPTNVSVKSRGGETVIPKADVLSIERTGSFEQDFRARLAKLDAKDVAGRIALAREAFERGQYDLARNTLEAAQVIDPNSRETADMLDVVQNQIRMERAKSEPAAAPTSRPQTPASLLADRRVLTPADIEAIRRHELQPTDANVRVRFDGDVKKRFADSQNIAFAEFNALAPVEQALQILKSGDDSMQDKVHIVNDPQAIIEFRRQIQPLVLQNCSTIGCHGGPQGARLVLLTTGETDAITYTNFYILQNYSMSVGGSAKVFSGGTKKLIERGRGEQSLLANYGLPSNLAEFDHPQVNGKPIQPIFRNRSDARYQAVVDWMNHSLNELEPHYGIRYTPPTAPPPSATQPAK